MMTEKMTPQETGSNRSILKSIGLLGLMRFFQLVSSVIAAKFIAIFIGPAGIGTLGLIKSAVNFIQSFTSFGYSVTTVKEIASKFERKDLKELETSIALSKKWSIYIGVLGMLITLPLSFFLSDWVYGNKTKFYWFFLLSVNFLFLSRNAFYSSLFQGKRQIKLVAISGAISSVLITIVIIPIYYFFKINGIIPAIVAANIIILIVNIYITRSLEISSYKTSLKEFVNKAKPMLIMGLVLSVNLIFSNLCHFLLRTFFKIYGEESSLGFYEAGVTIISTYAGTIFSVMSIDFFPKISGFHKDNSIVRHMVNQQIRISLLLVTPLVISFYVLDNTIITLLYSKEFLPAENRQKIYLVFHCVVFLLLSIFS